MADILLTPNFRASEFACHDGTAVPTDLLGNVRALCLALEVLRAELALPITIMSGYRTRAYNARCGGARRSRHVAGDAADIVVDGVAPDVVADLCLRLAQEGRIQPGGVGRYDGWTHVDVRGTVARWDNRRSGKRG